jgi:signal transduction histidine kinase/ActR/RegA family two-component response regulator
MQARRDATVRLLKAVLVLTVAVPATLFLYFAETSYRTSFTFADERLQRGLDAVSEHAVKVFQSLNVTITAVSALLGDRPDEALRAAEAELHAHLRDIVAELPAVDAIWVFDRDGRPVASSYRFPVPAELNVSDRDYFRAHLDPGVDTYVGQVLTPRVTTAPFFAVSRRRSTIDGSFAGVIVISVLPGDFHAFYARLAGVEGSSYTMLRDDGVVLARYPGPVLSNVKLDAGSGFMRSIRTHPEAGSYTAVSQVDGTERRFLFRRLEGLPIYVTMGLGLTEIRAEWWRFVASHLIFGLPATAAMFALVWLILLRTQDLYQEAARRVAAEETLRQSQKMEAVGQLTGGIAHDFNNLLTIIIGNLEIAQRKAGQSELERPLRNAIVGARRAAQLTQKLLAFARRQPLDPRAVDANRLLAGMSDLLRRTLGEQIEIEMVGGAGLWNVEADPTELEAAILNLALNARDAMPGGGKLTLETSNAFLDEAYVRSADDVAVGQYVLVAVSDTGEGMNPAVIERAFEPFFTTKESGQGTGLGLSQVYGFVKQSGGHIRIYSEVGHGTTVKMYLPRSDAVEAATREAAIEPGDAGRGETVLVVEDDDGVRSYIAEILRDLGYQVSTAADATSALALIRPPAPPPDLLLTDVVLPGLNGRQLADAARELRPGLRVLFMTGYSRNAIVHHGRLDRGVALIQKPVSQAALAAKVREVLDADAETVPAK